MSTFIGIKCIEHPLGVLAHFRNPIDKFEDNKFYLGFLRDILFHEYVWLNL
jgi:hypothetical protein